MSLSEATRAEMRQFGLKDEIPVFVCTQCGRPRTQSDGEEFQHPLQDEKDKAHSEYLQALHAVRREIGAPRKDEFKKWLLKAREHRVVKPLVVKEAAIGRRMKGTSYCCGAMYTETFASYFDLLYQIWQNRFNPQSIVQLDVPELERQVNPHTSRDLVYFRYVSGLNDTISKFLHDVFTREDQAASTATA